MQAFERGEQIEFRYNDGSGKWKETNGAHLWNWAKKEYRVKPKKHYVHFDTAEDFLAEQRKHIMLVTDNEIDYFASINGEGSVFLNPLSGCTPMKKTNFEDLFTNYQFGDEAPCGKEVEV